MSSRVVPLEEKHLKELVSSGHYLLGPGALDVVLKEDSICILWNDQVMLCGGICLMWPGRGHIWTVFNLDSKYNFVPVFRSIKSWLAMQLKTKYTRIEMSIDYGLDLAYRRAELLGFKVEIERAARYLPDGQDARTYVMVRT